MNKKYGWSPAAPVAWAGILRRLCSAPAIGSSPRHARPRKRLDDLIKTFGERVRAVSSSRRGR